MYCVSCISRYSTCILRAWRYLVQVPSHMLPSPPKSPVSQHHTSYSVVHQHSHLLTHFTHVHACTHPSSLNTHLRTRSYCIHHSHRSHCSHLTAALALAHLARVNSQPVQFVNSIKTLSLHLYSLLLLFTKSYSHDPGPHSTYSSSGTCLQHGSLSLARRLIAFSSSVSSGRGCRLTLCILPSTSP